MDTYPIGAAGNSDDEFAAIVSRLTTDPAPAPPSASAVVPSPPVPRQAPAPAPVSVAPQQTSPPAPSVPHGPPDPVAPVAPTYWGRHGLVAVYWIAILTGAIGQVIFFGELFGLGVGGYVAAGVIATTAETVMVSAGDTALHLRAQGRRTTQWMPFLVIAFIAAAAASGMNLSHWAPQSISMATIFGGIAFLGFLLHVVHGFGEGTTYLAEQARYQTEVAKRVAEAAKQRRQHAAQAAQAAATPAPAPARSDQPTTKASDTTTEKADKPAKKASPAKFTRDDALDALGARFWSLGPAEINSYMSERGHEPVNPATIRRWRQRDTDR